MQSPEQRQQSEEYLERTRTEAEKETGMPWEEFNLAAAEATDRLTETPWEEEGSISFALPATDIEGKAGGICCIEYDSLIDDEFREYSEEMAKEGKQIPPKENLRRIKGLVMQRGQEKLDLKDMCERCSVYMHLADTQAMTPEEKVQNFYGRIGDTNDGRPLVLVKADLASTLGLSVLFHELGHFVKNSSMHPINKSYENIIRQKLEELKELSADQKEEIIRAERGASAFAVKNMRRFFDGATLDKINKLVVQRGIKSYHDKFELIDKVKEEKEKI